jgi:hypothetical protein
MGVFPSQRELHRKERRFLRWFFVSMGLLALLYALLFVVRIAFG